MKTPLEEGRPSASSARVSVIVPAFNAAATLPETLASLVDQAFTDWEAIVVDDGSTDGTAGVAEAWAGRDPRIRLHRLAANGGVAAARNAGLAQARHEWVMFLDGDDRIDATHLSALMGAVQADPTLDGACTGFRCVDPAGSTGPTVIPPPLDDLFLANAVAAPFVVHALLVRGSLIRAVGGFDPGLAVVEDWDLWQRLGRRGTRLAVVRQGSALYRMRPGSHAQERHLVEGLRVIETMHGADPRVADPVPRYAAGLPAGDKPQRVVAFLASRLGVAAVVGGDPADLARHMPIEALADADPETIAERLLAGLCHAMGCTQAEVGLRWAAISPAVDRCLEALADRAAEPELAETVRLRLARKVADRVEAAALPLQLGRLLAVAVDLDRRLDDIAVPPEVEVVRCYAAQGGARRLIAELPAAGGCLPAGVLGRSLAEAHGCAITGRYLRRALRREVAPWRRLLMLIARRRTRRFLGQAIGLPPRRWIPRWRSYLGRNGDLVVPGLRASGPPSEPSGSPGLALATGEDRVWEQVFERADPWGYTSDYEQTKYRHTLELVPELRPSRALELACAEGHFTDLLAPRVGELIATDISETALARAAERCAAHANVTFRKLNFRQDPLPGVFDLIVCSEVLYYLSGRREVARLARRLAQHLRPGGHLLMTHANITVEDPSLTGFNWNRGIGGRGIRELFARQRALDFVSELRTPIYSVCLYRRCQGPTEGGGRAREILRREPSWPTAPQVLGRLDREGAVLSRPEADATCLTLDLPVLLYHRVADHGPPALAPYRIGPASFERQMAYLKRHGYRSIAPGDLLHAQRRRFGVLPGRAVLITFDDGYGDFARTAWPILQAYGYTATVFLVTDLAGAAAEWDRALGEPAPLMDWPEIQRLRQEGVTFGAHSATHPHLTRLGPRRLLDEGRRPREVMAARLGEAPIAMAYPYGSCDSLVRNAMAECGYRLAFTTKPARARYGDDPLALPRQTIYADDDLDAFVAKLGRAERAAPWQRLRYRLNRWRGRPA